MRAQGGGRIVLISSIGGVLAIPFQAFYSASKYALEGLGEALAYEVAPFGIDVTLVEPGNVRTDFTANRKMAACIGGRRRLQECTRHGGRGDGARRGERGCPRRRRRRGPQGPRTPAARPVGYQWAKSGERVGILAKRVLPHRVFEAAAKSSLGVK